MIDFEMDMTLTFSPVQDFSLRNSNQRRRSDMVTRKEVNNVEDSQILGEKAIWERRRKEEITF